MSLHLTRRAAILGLASLAHAVPATAGLFFSDPPEDLDLALERRTEGGLYIIGIAPLETPVRVGRMHSWTATVTDPKRRRIDDAEIILDGGMPQHGHGLPTAPAVTERLGEGRYLIEGMKFNMRGWWEIHLGIKGRAGSDRITFNLVL